MIPCEYVLFNCAVVVPLFTIISWLMNIVFHVYPICCNHFGFTRNIYLGWWNIFWGSPITHSITSIRAQQKKFAHNTFFTLCSSLEIAYKCIIIVYFICVYLSVIELKLISFWRHVSSANRPGILSPQFSATKLEHHLWYW